MQFERWNEGPVLPLCGIGLHFPVATQLGLSAHFGNFRACNGMRSPFWQAPHVVGDGRRGADMKITHWIAPCEATRIVSPSRASLFRCHYDRGESDGV